MKNRSTIVAGILFALVCFQMVPKSQAVNPPPDGGYAGATPRKGRAPSLTSLLAVSTRR